MPSEPYVVPADLSAAIAHSEYIDFLRATPWNNNFNYGGVLLHEETFFQDRVWVPPFVDPTSARSRQREERDLAERSLLARIDASLTENPGTVTTLTGDRGCGKTTLIHRFLYGKPDAITHWCDFEDVESAVDGRNHAPVDGEVTLSVGSLVNLFMTLFDHRVLKTSERTAREYMSDFLDMGHFELKRHGAASSSFLDNAANVGANLERMLLDLGSYVFKENRSVRGEIPVHELRRLLSTLTTPELIRLFYAALSFRVIKEDFQLTHYVVLDNVDAIHGNQRVELFQAAVEYTVAQIFGDLANSVPSHADRIRLSQNHIHTIMAVRHNRWLRDPSTTRGEGAVSHSLSVNRCFPIGEIVRRRHEVLERVDRAEFDADAAKFADQIRAGERFLQQKHLVSTLTAQTNGNLRLLCSLIDSITSELEPLPGELTDSHVGQVSHTVYRQLIGEGRLKVQENPITLTASAMNPLPRFALTILVNGLDNRAIRDLQHGVTSHGMTLANLVRSMCAWDHSLSANQWSEALWSLYRREAGLVWARMIRAIGFNGDEPSEFQAHRDSQTATIALTPAGLSLLSVVLTDFEFWNAVNHGGGGRPLSRGGSGAMAEVLTKLRLACLDELRHLRRLDRDIKSPRFKDAWLIPQFTLFRESYIDEVAMKKSGQRHSYWTFMTQSFAQYLSGVGRAMALKESASDLWLSAVQTEMSPLLETVAELQEITSEEAVEPDMLRTLASSKAWKWKDLESIASRLPRGVTLATVDGGPTRIS